MANKRHSASFNPELDETYGFMIDANNLYGGIMETEWLSLSNFSLIEGIELSEVLQTPPDSEFGYILEVDLKYPNSFRNLHADFPLAPVKKISRDEWLSLHQKHLKRRVALTNSGTQQKLCLTRKRTHYITELFNYMCSLDWKLQAYTGF